MWRYAYPHGDEDTKAKWSWALVRRVLSYAKPYRLLLALLLFLILVQTALGLITPLILRDLIDFTLPNGDGGRLNLLAAGLVLIPIISTGLSIIIRRYNSSIGEGVIYDLRRTLFAHLQHMSLRFFTNSRTGELMSRLNNDVVNAQTAISDTIIGIVTNSITVIATLAVMLTLEWRLTILGLLVLPVIYYPTRAIGVRLRRIAREQMDINAEMNAMMNETLDISGSLLVKLFGRQQVEIDRFSDRAARVRDIGIRRAVMGSQFWGLLGLIGVVGTAVVYWVGGNFVLQGTFTIGTIAAFAAYLGQLYGPLQYLVNAPVEFSTAVVSFERVFEVTDLPHEVSDKVGAVALKNVQGELVFDDVSFKYNGSSKGLLSEVRRYGRIDNVKAVLSGASDEEDSAPSDARTQARDMALEHISFAIHPGQLVALVGPSGAGKTTLTYLIPRLYDPTEGQILLDGLDLRDVTQASLNEHVGMVTQETHLFHDTIRTNLLYARLNATQSEIEAACKAANIHDFISSLPKGYDTIVGERGYRLSGGEKQRIAIARVILKNPRVLVLDEATSHLDSQSESLIQDALEKIMVGRTSIVIAHRLSTILSADVILVTDRGQIVERGSHEALIEQAGLYAQLYETQFRTQREMA